MSKISIIVNSYNPTLQQSHMTMACLAAIRKFTEPPYELVVVCSPSDEGFNLPIRDEYGVLNLDQEVVIKNEHNKNVYECYNMGAKAASGDLLFFIQSDVYVHEETINKLAKYLKKYDMAFPQQVPISRADVEQIYEIEDAGETHVGGRDAGLLAITREAFDRAGGWDERFRNLLGEAAFYSRCADAGVSWTCQTNAFITHIMAGNNLLKKDEIYNDEMAFDAKLLKEEYGIGS